MLSDRALPNVRNERACLSTCDHVTYSVCRTFDFAAGVTDP